MIRMNFRPNGKKPKRRIIKNNWEIFMEICSDMIKILPNSYPIINKKSNKKSLIIETRVLIHNEFVIKNTIQKLGDDWGHIIYCHDDNYIQIKSICDDISSEIEIRLLDDHLTRNEYNELLLSLNFWEEIDCEKVLVYQTDTLIINDFDNSFLECDYIGAAWGPGSHSNMINSKFINAGFNCNVFQGNGGLSIRNVKLMKDALLDESFKNVKNILIENTLDSIPEDCFFASYVYYNGYLPEESNKFSIEPSIGYKESLNIYDNPFGFHKIYNFFGYEDFIYDKIINKKLLEYKNKVMSFNKKDYDVIKNHNLTNVKLSVLISLYNYENYIEKCIDSVINNNFNGLEIIIINDYSTDDSLKKCMTYLNTNNNITIIDKKVNTGLIHTRNLGLELCLGEYVFILDADNFIYENCLQEHISVMISDNSLIACYGIIKCVDTDGVFIRNISNQKFDKEKLYKGNYIDAMAMFNKKKLLDIGNYNYELMDYGVSYEDYELWLRISESNYNVNFINKILSEYVVKSLSLTNINKLYISKLNKYLNNKYILNENK